MSPAPSSLVCLSLVLVICAAACSKKPSVATKPQSAAEIHADFAKFAKTSLPGSVYRDENGVTQKCDYGVGTAFITGPIPAQGSGGTASPVTSSGNREGHAAGASSRTASAAGGRWRGETDSQVTGPPGRPIPPPAPPSCTPAGGACERAHLAVPIPAGRGASRGMTALGIDAALLPVSTPLADRRARRPARSAASRPPRRLGKKAPPALAQQAAAAFRPTPELVSATASGPYVNFKVDRAKRCVPPIVPGRAGARVGRSPRIAGRGQDGGHRLFVAEHRQASGPSSHLRRR